MKYLSKPSAVVAEQFTGTRLSVAALQEFVSENDCENCEVTYQGEREPYALDITQSRNITILEAGDWLVISEGKLRGETAEYFQAHYEAVPQADPAQPTLPGVLDDIS